ncbi:MAG: hypothetical protein ACOCQH_03845 [Halanaerobiales bacterium]
MKLESCCNSKNNGSEVPFCCLQPVPPNLEIDKDRLKKENLEITFTPDLACCIREETVDCNINGANCEFEGKILKLVGCIEYAISTLDNSDPISGEKGNEAVAACCSGTVCVNNIVCCVVNGLECPEDLDQALIENPITWEFDDAKVIECPENGKPQQKFIQFSGRFFLPDICVPVPPPPPPLDCPQTAELETTAGNQYTISIVEFNGTWCYDVTVLPGSQDLSHWVLELCPDIGEDDISNVTIDGMPSTDIEIGFDPTTGVDGIKFDNLSQTAADGTVRYCFDLEGDFGITEVNVSVFSAGQGDVQTICGPEC